MRERKRERVKETERGRERERDNRKSERGDVEREREKVVCDQEFGSKDRKFLCLDNNARLAVQQHLDLPEAFKEAIFDSLINWPNYPAGCHLFINVYRIDRIF